MHILKAILPFVAMILVAALWYPYLLPDDEEDE